jgi:hypothetical protein
MMIMFLQDELEKAGVNPDDVEIRYDQSEYGTLFIEMLLDSDQHDRFSKQVREDSPPDNVQKPKQVTEPYTSGLQKAEKKKNKSVCTWAEPGCEEIQKPFNNENLKCLLEDGSKELNAEYTHQQIADWCRRWCCEDYNDRMDVPRELLDVIEDIDVQWELYLANTYSYDELTNLDFSRVRLPIDWFSNWAAKLKDITEQSASANR